MPQIEVEKLESPPEPETVHSSNKCVVSGHKRIYWVRTRVKEYIIHHLDTGSGCSPLEAQVFMQFGFSRPNQIAPRIFNGEESKNVTLEEGESVRVTPKGSFPYDRSITELGWRKLSSDKDGAKEVGYTINEVGGTPTFTTDMNLKSS